MLMLFAAAVYAMIPEPVTLRYASFAYFYAMPLR